jgi:YcxB-like protein
MIPITLRYRLTPEDVNKAYRFALELELDNWLYYLLSIISLTAYLVNSYIFGGLAKFYQDLHFILSITFVYFLYVIAQFRSHRFSQQQKILQTEYETVISPEMIEINSENGLMRMHLSAFQSYKVSKDLIVLYEHRDMVLIPRFHIFPRRFFLSEGHFKTFLSYLKANLGNHSNFRLSQ